MLKTFIEQTQKKLQQKQTDFYTADGLHVYFKEPLYSELDVERVVSKVEGIVPRHLREEVEMIIIGWFDEFEKRSINAFYKDGALYISNVQDNEADMYDDIIHEIAHSLESKYGYEIYGEVKFKGENLKEISVEGRAQKGIFLAFQYGFLAGIYKFLFFRAGIFNLMKSCPPS